MADRTFTIDLEAARRPGTEHAASADLWEVAKAVEDALQRRFADPLFVESVEINQSDAVRQMTKIVITIVAAPPGTEVDTVNRFRRGEGF
jgi:hypothetical protein